LTGLVGCYHDAMVGANQSPLTGLVGCYHDAMVGANQIP
jgi:hypothetical protein